MDVNFPEFSTTLFFFNLRFWREDLTPLGEESYTVVKKIEQTKYFFPYTYITTHLYVCVHIYV